MESVSMIGHDLKECIKPLICSHVRKLKEQPELADFTVVPLVENNTPVFDKEISRSLANPRNRLGDVLLARGRKGYGIASTKPSKIEAFYLFQQMVNRRFIHVRL